MSIPTTLTSAATAIDVETSNPMATTTLFEDDKPQSGLNETKSPSSQPKIIRRNKNNDDDKYQNEEESEDDEEFRYVPVTPTGKIAASASKTPKRRKTKEDGTYINTAEIESEDSSDEKALPSIKIVTPRNKAVGAIKNTKDEGYASQSTTKTKRIKREDTESFEKSIATSENSSLILSSPLQRKFPGSAKPSSRKPIANYSPVTKRSLKRSASEDDDDEALEAEEAAIQARLQAELKAAESSRAKDHQAVLDANNQFLEAKRRLNWHPQEIEVLERLSYRGYEPLMHASWFKDFTTFPSVLFTTVDEDTIINTLSENEFRGIKALESLIGLGARVRANTRVNKSTATMMKKQIESYIHHTEVDAGYASKDFIPSVVVVTAPFTGRKIMTKAQGDATEERAIAQLRKLAARHRAALALPEPHHIDELGQPELYRRAPPVVFSIICSGTKVFFASLDAAITDDTVLPNVMTAFDFSQLGHDVWNGIAVALLCINVRNATFEFIEELKDLEAKDKDSDA